jgi:dTDP-glucose 4,6-dehydratase
VEFEHILVTGGAGFIGSNFVHYSLDHWPERRVTVVDKIGYAGNVANLDGVAHPENLKVVVGDVADPDLMARLVAEVDGIVHFAAESMVDRSIMDGRPFVQSNVLGTYTLYDAVRRHGNVKKILHISTPEVYGERRDEAAAEEAPFRPRNIYAASKAGGEMFARAFSESFGLSIVMTRGSNAIGPRQHLEKVLPLWITRALLGKSLLLYGDGSAVRDWLHVQDMNSANDLVLRDGTPGEAFNIVSGQERSLLQLAQAVLTRLDRPLSLIEHVGDRTGHDLRYHMGIDRLTALGWSPRYDFEQTLDETVAWYVENEAWWRPVLDSEDYVNYLRNNFDPKRAS